MNRMIQLAVAAVLVLVALPLIFTKTSPTVFARGDSNLVYCPDGGLLEARDANGLTLGPCVLKHTDVKATVQGRFTRVTVTQKYHNPHKDKIEAVYTFPLSHRAAVDRMNMTIGDRVIIGQVREREAAKQMYESAKAQGNIASLLEQERPNIFTQNIANIDPGADIDIEISYVETLESKDGVYSFAFPTVVSPRYIPGQTPQWRSDEQARGEVERGYAPPPSSFKPRHGIVLSAPAQVELVGWKDQATKEQAFDADTFATALAQADAITPPPPQDGSGASMDADKERAAAGPATADVVYQFETIYPDGRRERGTVRSDYTGEVGGRWYYLPRHERSWIRVSQAPPAGEPFARPTAQVPDADRITPTPVRPPFRSGQDISVTVDLDTGGAGLTEVNAPLHQVRRQDASRRPDGLASRATIVLAGQNEIPNRDFVLNWKQTSDTINDAVFASHTKQGDFFAIMLDPPARVEDAQAVPRELIFVLDTSGSMNGPPIEKAKELAGKMVQTMRPQDTFNFITFAGATSVLWEKPRPNTDANRQEALAFFSRKGGSGGTEMMTAINAALEQRAGGAPVPLTLEDLANMPADGRNVSVGCLVSAISKGEGEQAGQMSLRVRPGLLLKAQNLNWSGGNPNAQVTLAGQWTTIAGERVLNVQSVTMSTMPVVNPLRIVVFLTDGEVGNDMAIIDAVKRNRGTTRVFSYGIGNSVNRYLLSEVAKQGGGEAEFILIPRGGGQEELAAATKQADDAARRLHEKTRTPVLANITLEFSPNLAVADLEPGPGQIPDMYDVKPLVLLGRFTQPPTADGFVTIRGITGSGLWEKTLKLSPQAAADSTERRLSNVGGDGVVATLWARARVDALMNGHLADIQHGTTPAAIKQRIIQLGENFGIMSQFTSFVAVDYQRVTIEGRPRLVRVPVELPDQTAWENYFCSDVLVQPVEKLSEWMDRSEEYKARADSENSGHRYLGLNSGGVEKMKSTEARPQETAMLRAPRGDADAGADRTTSRAAPHVYPSAKPSAPSKSPAAPKGAPPPPAPAPASDPAPSALSAGDKAVPNSGAPGNPGGASKPPSAKQDDMIVRNKLKQVEEAKKDASPTRPAGTSGSPSNGPGAAVPTDAPVSAVKEQTPDAARLELRLIRESENRSYEYLPSQKGAVVTQDQLSPANSADFSRDGQATVQDLYDFLDAYFGEGGGQPVIAGGQVPALSTPSTTPTTPIRKVETFGSATAAPAALPLPQESTPRRMAPLVAARLMAASLKTGQFERAAALRDRFLPQFPDSKPVKDAAALIPAAKPDTEKGAAGDDAAKSGSPAPATDPAAPNATAIDALVRQLDEAAATEMMLARRLDRDLYMKLPGNVTVSDDKAESVLVTILLDAFTPERLEALKKAGLDVRSSVEKDKIVVGFIKLTKLEGLALLDGVKKIEPVEDAVR